jgi:NodT family efflux transporter outer membrane factor (OMF) lipoprotein
MAVHGLLRVALATALATLAGCATVGPDYTPPALKIPAAWEAALPHGGSTGALLAWWQGFNDPTLDLLLRAAEADHPTLGQAAAAIAAARASRDQAGALALPALNAGIGATRSGSLRAGDAGGANPLSASQAAMTTVSSAGLDASWEIDLFGSVRRNREAAASRVQAREADWHDARVSLAAEVASEYVRYRACQLLAQSQRDNLDSLRKTAAGIQVAVENQLTAPAELTLASAGVANASASLTAQAAECELGVKSLVALTGLDEPKLRQHLGQEVAAIPVPAALEVRAVPTQLLSQRPDLVAAERTLAAASADIGVAEASRYPRLSLLGSVAVGRTSAGGTTFNTSPWSFGPSLSLPLFDGGRLRAQVSSARAGYDMALASYQGAVRSAVRETEQSLVRLDAAGKRLDDVAASARDYRRYFESAQENWQAGGISLLTLEESRRSALQAEQTLISTRRDRVLYGIALYKALGGGWQNTDTTSSTGVSQ